MQIELDPRGLKVVVFGSATGTRQAVRRFLRDGATVTLAVDGPVPVGTDQISGVRYAGQPGADDTAALLRLVGPAWMVVLVGTPDPLSRRLSELARQLHVLVLSEEPAAARGQVTLVGGGPGRTGLLTLDGAAALRRADVVFYDRLAPTADLAELAPGADLVDVGKSPYHHPVGQRSIEDQLIARARSGESVVRLKGGDPFVFGRGAEEMQACLSAGVPVRVVPGVSSALAVPAACGIPVTHRGITRSFAVVSGHVPPSTSELTALVQLGGTIVILMGMANLRPIVSGLIAAGLAAEMPVAVVERGFSDSQRSTVTTVGALLAVVRQRDITSPAVVVIGQVVALTPTAQPDEGVLELFGCWSPSPAAAR